MGEVPNQWVLKSKPKHLESALQEFKNARFGNGGPMDRRSSKDNSDPETPWSIENPTADFSTDSSALELGGFPSDEEQEAPDFGNKDPRDLVHGIDVGLCNRSQHCQFWGCTAFLRSKNAKDIGLQDVTMWITLRIIKRKALLRS